MTFKTVFLATVLVGSTAIALASQALEADTSGTASSTAATAASHAF